MQPQWIMLGRPGPAFFFHCVTRPMCMCILSLKWPGAEAHWLELKLLGAGPEGQVHSTQNCDTKLPENSHFQAKDFVAS